MGHQIPKQYLPLAGKPILSHSLAVFCTSPHIHSICLVVPPSDIAFCHNEIVEPLKPQKRVSITSGGDERQNSVFNGLKTLSAETELVVIHDGVRPFLSHEMLERCILGAQKHGACIAAIPVSETLKSADENDCVVTTMDRHQIYSAQTPQAFTFQQILYAHERAQLEGFCGTDDAMLLERLGKKVKIVSGSRFNIKITTPEDLRLSEAIICSGELAGLDSTGKCRATGIDR
jgi:2-C-methyl-D-erythritol 4-phosphate cytidylyltransferase